MRLTDQMTTAIEESFLQFPGGRATSHNGGKRSKHGSTRVGQETQSREKCDQEPLLWNGKEWERWVHRFRVSWFE